VLCCNKYCSDYPTSLLHYFTGIPFSYSSTVDVGEGECRSKYFRSAFLSKTSERLCGKVTYVVGVFSLERDTCVLIVVSQGARDSFLLEFVKRYY